MKNNKMKKRYIFLLVFLGVSLFVGFFVVIWMFVMALMKGDVYDMSLQNVRQSEEVALYLGEPLEPGYFVLGSVSMSGGSGDAEINFSVEGPLGSADVYVIAKKKLGEWSILQQVVQIDESNERIALVTDGIHNVPLD
jgi:hypothetical protein